MASLQMSVCVYVCADEGSFHRGERVGCLRSAAASDAEGPGKKSQGQLWAVLKQLTLVEWPGLAHG